MMKLVISCMDRRLNRYLAENFNDSIVIRNAGANVNSLRTTLVTYKNLIDEVVLLPHTDCGAMKVVYSNIVEGKKAPSTAVEDKLIKQFTKMKFSSLSELERLNLKLQEENLRKIFSVPVRAELIDVNKISFEQSKEPFSVYVTSPGKPIDLSSGVYIISSDESEVWDSLDIAIYVMRINKIKSENQNLLDQVRNRYPSVTVEKLNNR
ncbi:carbonic anhydrase [Sulfolobus acidocaldarius SUSAZ]|nr:carbonic anhydrase [Sulfolobus acidocaldarius SUSAZ]